MKNKRPEGYESKEQYGIRIEKLKREVIRKRALMLLDRETLEKTPKTELAKKFNLTAAQVRYAIQTNRVTSMASKSHPLVYLSEANQLAVADHLRRIMRQTDAPFPVSMAKSMLQRVRKIASGDERQPSNKWFRYFLVRHNFESSLIGMKDKETVLVVPETIKEWIEENEAILSTVPPENLANMAETGFQIGDERSLVNESVPLGKKVPGSYRGEPVTAIECIVANGVALPPFIVMKKLSESAFGKLVQDNVDPDAKWGYGQTESGYSCKRIMLDWLDHYDRHSAAVAVEGCPRVLLMDNFPAHWDEEIENEAAKRGIKVIYLPANINVNLHPLETKIFGLLKQKYFTNLSEDEDYVSVFGQFPRAVYREGWIRSYSRARESVLREKSIQTAFEITGIAIFNAEKIQNHNKKLAKERDIKGKKDIQLELVEQLFELNKRSAKRFRPSYFKLLARYFETKIDEIDNEDEIRQVIDRYFNEPHPENESSPVLPHEVWEDLTLEAPPSTSTSAEAPPSPLPPVTNDSAPDSTSRTHRNLPTSPTATAAIELRNRSMHALSTHPLGCDCWSCDRSVTANRDDPLSVKYDLLREEVVELHKSILSFANAYLYAGEDVDKCKQRCSLMEDSSESITATTPKSKTTNSRQKQSRVAKSSEKVRSIPQKVVTGQGIPPGRHLQKDGEEELEVIPQKRGPGRPRKRQSQENGEESSTSTYAIPRKRGPGRPRKKQCQGEEDE